MVSSVDIKSAPDELRVWKIFKYCQAAFGNSSVNINFPKNTDPKKTYKWRYLSKFVERIDKEWNITDEGAMDLIDAIVKYAIKKNMLHKGLALLSADKFIEECCNITIADSLAKKDIAEKIKSESVALRNIDLFKKQSNNGLPEIVKLYMRGNLSITHLAHSQRCHDAMMKLKPLERKIMPSGKELLNARIKLETEPELKLRIKKALGADWKTNC